MFKKLKKLIQTQPENHYKGIYLQSAGQFLEMLHLKGIGKFHWSYIDDLDELPLGRHICQEGVEILREQAGILFWMKRGAQEFHTTFVEVNMRMKALGVKDVEKRLDRNKVNWNWRWEEDGYRCLLTYWNFEDIRKGEGMELFVRPKG